MRKKRSSDDFFWNHDDYVFDECRIDCGNRYWLADPFLFEKNNVTYVFFEAFDLVKMVGKIGYCIRRDDGSFTSPKIVIDKNYHMSFPYIFEYGGSTYIMPETSGDWRLRLFKAINFPDEWEPAEILLPDAYCCDSIILEMESNRWLLTNEMYHHPPVESFGSCWVKNYLYKLEGLSVQGDGIKVAEGDWGIRNAGKSFMKNGVLYRIGQDCRLKQYGRGISLFEIDSLQPYHEKMLWSKDFQEISSHIQNRETHNIIGVHTYNFSPHWEIIDFSQMVPIPFNLKIKRKLQYLKRFVNPIIRKITILN